MGIWFWGAGKYLERIMDVVTDRETIAGIVDKSNSLQGARRKGVLVYAPQEAQVGRKDIVIITAFLQYETIYKEALACFNLEANRIVCFFDEAADYGLWKEYIDVLKWEMVYQNILMGRRLDMLEREIQGVKNLKYEIPDMLNKNRVAYPRIRSGEEALYKIIVGHQSMCRFGDGEFELMAGRKRAGFQMPDEKLSRRLREVLAKDDVGVLICIADNYGSLDAYTENAAKDIRLYMTEDVRREHMELLDQDREYYDAYVSRPYILFRDKERAKTLFGLWKKVWKDREILIVEGCLTRNGYKNDLFDDTKSVSRLLAPAEDAWKYYEQMTRYIADNISKETLIIISLGPTATVLAYDLSLMGYQAIDIGHIDNEYEWYLRKAEERVDIAYKYVHEIVSGRAAKDIHDQAFDRQVIARIGC